MVNDRNDCKYFAAGFEDSVASFPPAITDLGTYEMLKKLVGCFGELSPAAKLKLLGIIFAGIRYNFCLFLFV